MTWSFVDLKKITRTHSLARGAPDGFVTLAVLTGWTLQNCKFTRAPKCAPCPLDYLLGTAIDKQMWSLERKQYMPAVRIIRCITSVLTCGNSPRQLCDELPFLDLAPQHTTKQTLVWPALGKSLH